MASQYSPFTSSGRYYLAQKIRQELKRIICFVRGHDTKPRPVATPEGYVKANVCSFKNDQILYRCHRCWKHVPKKK